MIPQAYGHQENVSSMVPNDTHVHTGRMAMTLVTLRDHSVDLEHYPKCLAVIVRHADNKETMCHVGKGLEIQIYSRRDCGPESSS